MDLHEHAFAHACAVLGPGDEPVEVAIAAVRRGGRSRAAVLGHARHEALARSASAPPPDLAAPAPPDLPGLALALASMRPPLERAIVDLDTRHGLDRAGLGRALGVPPAEAADRAAAVHLEWQRDLDPVVLAALGPGGCEGMAALLEPADGDAAGRGSLGDIVDAGRRVAIHVEDCADCRDRLRSMVSVRTLLGQRPLEAAPAAVRAAAAPGRLRRAAPPPPLEGALRKPAWRRAAVPVAVLTAVLVVTPVALVARRDPAGQQRVDALTKVPAGGTSLVVEPASVTGAFPAPVMLRNRSDRPIQWSAEPAVAWVAVEPRAGELAAGEAVPVEVSVDEAAPEGEADGVVRISSTDGSTAVVRLTASVEHPPDIAATAEGCSVIATVEDESEIAGVELHWLDPREQRQPLAKDTAGFTGRLPAAATPLTWWVTARDSRGNLARTPDQIRPPAPSCD